MATLDLRNSLVRMETFPVFREIVQSIYVATVKDFDIGLKFDPNRQRWCYDFWLEDLARLQLQVSGPADHLKRASFLTFWLRREPPVAIWDDSAADPTHPMVEFLMRYGREYCAFRVGYELALYYECNGSGIQYEKARYALSDKYVLDLVEMLKKKSVSPHAMYLIFMSFFHRPKRLG